MSDTGMITIPTALVNDQRISPSGVRLYALLASSEGLKYSELAARMGRERSSLAQHLKTLVDAGYVVRLTRGSRGSASTFHLPHQRPEGARLAS